MQKPMFRDVWGLWTPNAKYNGAFPGGLIQRIKKRWWGQNRLWLFSGSYKDRQGTTVDINKTVNPDVCCNCEQLPFKDSSFDFVMLDPPYSKEEAIRLYDLPYFNIVKVMNEAARVCAANGYVLLLHRLIPWVHPSESHHKKRLMPVGVVGIYTIAGYTNMRALTIFQKQETLNESNSRIMSSNALM